MKTLNQARIQQPSKLGRSSLCAKQSCSLFPISRLEDRWAHSQHAYVLLAANAKSLKP